MSTLHSRYTSSWDSWGFRGLTIWVALTLFPQTNRPFQKARWGHPHGVGWTLHVTCQFCLALREVKEGSLLKQLDSASACLHGVRYFDDRLFSPCSKWIELFVNIICGAAGWPTVQLLLELLYHRLSCYSDFTQHYLLRLKSFIQGKVGDKNAFLFLPATHHLFFPLNQPLQLSHINK